MIHISSWDLVVCDLNLNAMQTIIPTTEIIIMAITIITTTTMEVFGHGSIT